MAIDRYVYQSGAMELLAYLTNHPAKALGRRDAEELLDDW